jgi:hypothetical protein
MPGTSHVIYGLAIIIPILYFTKDNKSFSYKAAFIFLANTYIGPDAAQIFVGLPFHSMLGFLIFAVPLSAFYSYFTRFALKRTESKFGFTWEDEGIRTVKWKNAYCLTAAGGISHFFIDQFYHFGKSMNIWPRVSITHDEMLAWGGDAYHVFTALSLIGYVATLSLIIFSYYFMRKGYKETLVLFSIVSALIIILILTVGGETFSGERDIGVTVHSIVYVLIPLFLIFYAARDINVNPNLTPDTPTIDRNLLIKVISLFLIIFASFFFVVSIIALIAPDDVLLVIGSLLDEDASGYKGTLLFAGVLFLILSSILLVGSIGLLLKNNFCRNLVIIVNTPLIIIVFPFAVVLMLHEKEVKEMFEKNRE